jgi:hypothetical protein
MVPVLAFLPLFLATLYSTNPIPVPVLPEVIIIQEALLTAVQLQFVSVVTSIVPVSPVAGNDALDGAEIE